MICHQKNNSKQKIRRTDKLLHLYLKIKSDEPEKKRVQGRDYLILPNRLAAKANTGDAGCHIPFNQNHHSRLCSGWKWGL